MAFSFQIAGAFLEREFEKVVSGSAEATAVSHVEAAFRNYGLPYLERAARMYLAGHGVSAAALDALIGTGAPPAAEAPTTGSPAPPAGAISGSPSGTGAQTSK